MHNSKLMQVIESLEYLLYDFLSIIFVKSMIWLINLFLFEIITYHEIYNQVEVSGRFQDLVQLN